MTNESNIELILNKIQEMFEHPADPEVFPSLFSYQVKLAKYELALQNANR